MAPRTIDEERLWQIAILRAEMKRRRRLANGILTRAHILLAEATRIQQQIDELEARRLDELRG